MLGVSYFPFQERYVFQVWQLVEKSISILCGMKFSWDVIFTTIKSRENKLPPKKFCKNLLFTLLNFNEIGGKLCNGNDIPYFLYNNLLQ